MDKLWAPWRIHYIQNKKQNKCIFCQGHKDSGSKYVIFKTRRSMVMLNAFPYNNGHLLLSPIRHVRDIAQLSDAEVADLFQALKKSQAILNQALKPQGYNIGLNLGRSAGAGITGHLHLHIVPRWTGDTNFMPITSHIKVISQSLDELSKLLKKCLTRQK